jgi:hypothetical protein
MKMTLINAQLGGNAFIRAGEGGLGQETRKCVFKMKKGDETQQRRD